MTQLDGRTVERIRVDPESACAFPGCPREPLYWYVDPETFYPVATEGAGGLGQPGRPTPPGERTAAVRGTTDELAADAGSAGVGRYGGN